MTTATSSPRERRAKGSEPTTSARPPVLAKGAASEETIRTRATHELYQARVGKTRGWARPSTSELRSDAQGGALCHGAAPLEVEFCDQHQHAAGYDGALSGSINAGRRTNGAGDGSERSGSDVAVGHGEGRVVEQVEGAGADLEERSFRDGNGLSHLGSEVEESRSPETVRRDVAIIRLLDGIGGGGGRRGKRGGGETARIDIRAVLAQQAGVEQIGQDAAAESGGEQSGDLAVGGRKRPAAVGVQFGSDGPAAQRGLENPKPRFG